MHNVGNVKYIIRENIKLKHNLTYTDKLHYFQLVFYIIAIMFYRLDMGFTSSFILLHVMSIFQCHKNSLKTLFLIVT